MELRPASSSPPRFAPANAARGARLRERAPEPTRPGALCQRCRRLCLCHACIAEEEARRRPEGPEMLEFDLGLYLRSARA